jgi:MFS transporter, MFS domain-containing protein family, molybdate-anion transporter
MAWGTFRSIWNAVWLVLVLVFTLKPVGAFASPSTLAISTNSNYRMQDAIHLRTAHSTPTTRPWQQQHSRCRQRRGHLPLDMALSFPRGGATTAAAAASLWNSSPDKLFNASLLALAVTAALAKIIQRASTTTTTKTNGGKPKSVQSLQRRFLAAFWLLRCSDWLQGPYFYEVYASKVFRGVPASLSLVSQLFLTGFAATALFGPSVGRAADQYGRKRATLAFTVVYALGALSTKSTILSVLVLGRILSGIGTSLLFSAPEAWLVGEAQKSGDDPDGKYLGETFGMAYAGDSIVAIFAGQMAGLAAAKRGPTGPFELSTAFLGIGGILAAVLWKENVATFSKSSSSSNKDAKGSVKPSIRDAIKVVQNDPKIMLVGGVQSLFEAAMYIFVLQWPPAMSMAIGKAFKGTGVATPYGTIFSCFMACCLLGSTIFGQLTKMAVPTETFALAMLSVATVAMTGGSWMVSNGGNHALWGLMLSFFAFEACVGMYFPSIGTLRSKYVPDSHRSVIMNLFGIPLNVLVVGVFLSIQKLGVQGALSISSGALAAATLCMLSLRRSVLK